MNMSEVISERPSFLEEAVGEYKIKQRDVMKWFVYGCIELWEILYKYSVELQKEKLWMKFLDEVGIHVTTANQQIRLYEISKEKIEAELLAEVVTNWEKLHLFLALNDEQKEQIMQKGLDAQTTTADFRSIVTEIKTGDVVLPDAKFEDEAREKIEKQVGGNPLLVDTKRASKTLQEDMKLPVQGRELVEAVLFLEKTKEIFRNSQEVPTEVLVQMKELVSKQILEVEEEFTILFW